ANSPSKSVITKESLACTTWPE
ncbi:unnamed protein product, partial [Oikopleura dioica]